MKSKQSQQVEVVKRINLGHFPLFIQLAHKSLEKAMPEGVKTSNGGTTFVVPKDILTLSVTNQAILDNITSIEFVYNVGKDSE